ncbi:hypothetical protein [Brooklawnia sp.]|uniref:hypothetical protein n=1 Tax=Brooklawnia sp. TaxID=2699740 RepID=UPI00311FB6F1
MVPETPEAALEAAALEVEVHGATTAPAMTVVAVRIRATGTLVEVTRATAIHGAAIPVVRTPAAVSPVAPSLVGTPVVASSAAVVRGTLVRVARLAVEVARVREAMGVVVTPVVLTLAVEVALGKEATRAARAIARTTGVTAVTPAAAIPRIAAIRVGIRVGTMIVANRDKATTRAVASQEEAVRKTEVTRAARVDEAATRGRAARTVTTVKAGVRPMIGTDAPIRQGRIGAQIGGLAISEIVVRTIASAATRVVRRASVAISPIVVKVMVGAATRVVRRASVAINLIVVKVMVGAATRGVRKASGDTNRVAIVAMAPRSV